MKATTRRRQNLLRPPLAWREAEYAARKFNANDTCDDRVSEEIFDIEDERVEVDTIIQGMIQDEN